MRRAVRPRAAAGFTLIELLIGVTVVGVLVALAVPNLRAAQQRSKYVQAACDSKTAVIQGIVYTNEQSRNPGTMQTLRDSGYVNVGDTDPWGQPWVYSPVFADTGTPAPQDEMGVCSLCPHHTGACGFPCPAPASPNRTAAWATPASIGLGTACSGRARQPTGAPAAPREYPLIHRRPPQASDVPPIAGLRAPSLCRALPLW